MSNSASVYLSSVSPVNMISVREDRSILDPPGRYVLPPDRATEFDESLPE